MAKQKKKEKKKEAEIKKSREPCTSSFPSRGKATLRHIVQHVIYLESDSALDCLSFWLPCIFVPYFAPIYISAHSSHS